MGEDDENETVEDLGLGVGEVGGEGPPGKDGPTSDDGEKAEGGNEVELSLTPEGLQAVVRMLDTHLMLTHVDISGLGLGDKGTSRATVHSDTILDPSITTDFDLYPTSNHTTHVGANELGPIIAANATIEQLRMESNSISAEGGESMFRALGINMGLRTLSLAHNPLGSGSSGLGNGAIAELAGALRLNNAIESVDISDSDLNPPGARAVGDPTGCERTGTTTTTTTARSAPPHAPTAPARSRLTRSRPTRSPPPTTHYTRIAPQSFGR